MNITLVTSNKNKLSEAQQILGFPIRNIDIDLDELQEMDAIKISDHKVHQAWARVGEPVVVWDTSVYIDCLNGFPGPLIKWFWKTLTLEKICQIAKSFNNAKIWNETILTYYDGKEVRHFIGRMDGAIPETPRGDYGFAWDKIFIPDGDSRTYSEIPTEEVLIYRSHRIALEKLRDFVSESEKKVL